MNIQTILFFVLGGIVSDSHKEAATALATATGKKVVFRNASQVDDGGKLETNGGVAGAVPDSYRAKFAVYDVAAPDAPVAPSNPDPVNPEGSGKLNALGLPEGHPDTREALKEALAAAGVEFHGNAPTEKLVTLYGEAGLANA